MATAVLIDLSNYDTLLKQSTTSRGSTPNGNVYFNKTTGKIEFITKQELPQINLGSGLEDNPLDETLGIKFEAIYAFENQERKVDEDLRKYDRWTSGTFKFGGAYNFVNGRTPSITADRSIIRGSGWNEYNASGVVTRIYFGNKGLGTIFPTSQPYNQLAPFGVPTDYAKLGQIDEAVQVYGDATNGNFDSRTYEAVSVRTYGNNYDRKITTTDLGISELGGYSTGFAVSESSHLTTNPTTMPFADVWTTPTGVWLGMTLEELVTPQVETGFTQADGSFTWVLNNPNGANLDQCVAYLDAIATVDADINAHATNTTFGKRVNTWYYYDAQGRIVTRSGTADGKGLFIEGITGADKQRVVYTANDASLKTYPFYVTIIANVGAGAVADTQSWFHDFYQTNYNTPTADTIEDSSLTPVKGNVAASPFRSGNNISFEYDYDGNGGTPKNCIMLCEGDGGVTQAKTLFTINNASATINISCIPSTENNV